MCLIFQFSKDLEAPVVYNYCVAPATAPFLAISHCYIERQNDSRGISLELVNVYSGSQMKEISSYCLVKKLK